MKSHNEHIIEELITYVVQCVIFFIIMLLSTDFFRNKTALEKLFDSRLSSYQDGMTAFFIPILAILAVVGLMFLILRFFGEVHKYYHKIDIALREIPKVFYLIGSSIGVLIFVASLKIINGEQNYFNLTFLGLLAIIGYFGLGCFLSYFLSSHPHAQQDS